MFSGSYDFSHLNFENVAQAGSNRNYYQDVSNRYHRPLDLLLWGSPPVEPNSDPPGSLNSSCFLPTPPQSSSSSSGPNSDFSGPSPTEGLAELDPLFDGHEPLGLFDHPYLNLNNVLGDSVPSAPNLDLQFYPSPEELPLSLEPSSSSAHNELDTLINALSTFESSLHQQHQPFAPSSGFEFKSTTGTPYDQISETFDFPFDPDAPLFDLIPQEQTQQQQQQQQTTAALSFPPLEDLLSIQPQNPLPIASVPERIEPQQQQQSPHILTIDPVTAVPCAVTLSFEEYSRLVLAAAGLGVTAPGTPVSPPVRSLKKSAAAAPIRNGSRGGARVDVGPLSASTRTKEHACPAVGCDKAFWRKDALRRHMKNSGCVDPAGEM